MNKPYQVKSDRGQTWNRINASRMYKLMISGLFTFTVIRINRMKRGGVIIRYRPSSDLVLTKSLTQTIIQRRLITKIEIPNSFSRFEEWQFLPSTFFVLDQQFLLSTVRKIMNSFSQPWTAVILSVVKLVHCA